MLLSLPKGIIMPTQFHSKRFVCDIVI